MSNLSIQLMPHKLSRKRIYPAISEITAFWNKTNKTNRYLAQFQSWTKHKRQNYFFFILAFFEHHFCSSLW